VVLVVLLARRREEPPLADRVPLDVIGATLLSIGLGLAVYGILRSSEWGWVIPRPGGPSVLGVSPTICLIVLGGLTVWAFFEWEARLIAQGREPLVRPSIFRYQEMNAGLTMFFVQYLVQAGVFFTIPLFLSVALGLSALETGIRILPLSIALLAGAVGIPKFFPRASPRLVVRLGVLAMLAGTLVLILALDPDAAAAIVTVPLLLIGLGIGAFASQLGAVTVSAVPDKLAGEVGGLQNTATNLGAAIGTALAGSILIAALTTSFLTSVTENPDIPPSVKDQASVQLAAGIPFMSDADLKAALDEAGGSPDVAAEAIEANEQGRVDGLRSALSVLALIALSGLFLARAIPKTPKSIPES